MRGIGRGQTLHLFAIPEVNSLIAKIAKTSAPQSLAAVDGGAALTKVLRDVVGWLVVNSMKSETVQFNMLCEQAIYNVFRKNAYKTIQSSYKNYGTKGLSEQAILALDLFRERLDFSVENAIPTHILKCAFKSPYIIPYLTQVRCPVSTETPGFGSRQSTIPHIGC